MSFLFITDVPTPYRGEMYNSIAESLPDLEVWYFQKESKIRSWVFDPKNMKHKYWIAGGFHTWIGIYPLFINPHLVIKLLFSQPREIILAAGWNDFDVLCIVILKRMRLIKGRIGFWSEANHLTIGASRDNFLKFIVRRFVYNTCDGYQLISGEMTRLTFKLWKVKDSEEIFFPNTIQEEVHKNKREIKGLENNDQTQLPRILISARLDEKYKGILNFLSSLSNDQLSRVEIHIAGEGVDKERIDTLILKRELQNNVILLGQLSEEEMAKAFSEADAFCLPSYSDPSPLTVIEALQWNLPLLISNHCGNHFEAVIKDKNGITFSPLDSDEISKAFDQFLDMAPRWKKMGINSGQIFKSIFSKEKILQNFLEKIGGKE